jgi:hypothetical protein
MSCCEALPLPENLQGFIIYMSENLQGFQNLEGLIKKKQKQYEPKTNKNSHATFC